MTCARAVRTGDPCASAGIDAALIVAPSLKIVRPVDRAYTFAMLYQ